MPKTPTGRRREDLAIQAKCYDEDYYVTKGDVDAFLTESIHEKIDYRLLIATTNRLGPHAKGVITHQHQVRPVHTLLLEGLQNLSIDWPASIDRLDHAAVRPALAPLAHQDEAIPNVLANLGARGN